MKTLTQNNVNKFLQLVQQGIDCWVEAGELAVKMIDEDSSFIEEVCKSNAMLTEEVVLSFVRLGRKTLHPRLVIADGAGVRKLRKLPYALQERYISNPVELLVNNGEQWDSLNVDVLNLTSEQASQVFTNDGVRSAGAQRAYLEDKARNVTPPIRVNETYRIVRDEFVVMTPAKFTKKQLARILADME